MRRRFMVWLYGLFGRLPRVVRRRIVRAVSPKFTVGAICFVFRDDGHVLLVRHSYHRRWGTVGGLSKRREPPRSAAIREAGEEVGLRIELVGEPAVVVEARLRRVDVVYQAGLAPGVRPGDAHPHSAEIVEARWFPPGELPDISSETALAWAALMRRGLEPAHA